MEKVGSPRNKRGEEERKEIVERRRGERGWRSTRAESERKGSGREEMDERSGRIREMRGRR